MLSKKQLVIKKSGIPGAGKGLFTKQDIEKGMCITEYKGKIKTWKAVQQSKNFNGYVYYINRNHVVDAFSFKKAFGRYANDANGLVRVKGLRNNSSYIVNKGKVFIEAIKNITAGSEILVSYGKEYWDVVRYNNRIDKNQKK